jgi:hypothetical protein
VAAEHPVRPEADVLHVPGLAAEDAHSCCGCPPLGALRVPRKDQHRGKPWGCGGNLVLGCVWDGLKASRGSKLVCVVKSAIKLCTPDTSIADDCGDDCGCRLHRALQGCQPGWGKIRQKPVVICPELCWKLVLVLEKGPEVSNSDDTLGCPRKPL